MKLIRISWEKTEKVSIILQTIAVVVTLPMIYWQSHTDLRMRRKAQTMQHIESMTYRGDIDIKLCGLDSVGEVKLLTKTRAIEISKDSTLKAEILKILAEFEFYATGVNQDVFDFEVANRLNGGYMIEQYRRYFAYIQLALDYSSNKSSKQRRFDQLEKFVMRLNEHRKPSQDLPVLNRE